jgi:hypothetical protein
VSRSIAPRRRAIALGLAASWLAFVPRLALFAQAQAAPQAAAAPPAAKPAATLAEARSALGRAIGSPDLAARIAAAAETLPPLDAYLLLAEFSPKVDEAKARSALQAHAGDLAFLLGRFADAATCYEESSKGNPEGKGQALLLRAARCRLAAGEADTANQLAASVLMDSGGEDNRVAALLIGAWAKALERKDAEAAIILDSLRGAGSQHALKPEARRELLFIAWVIAQDQAKAAEARALAKEFPQSAEAALAAGTTQPPPLPHWYLSYLAPSAAQPPEVAKPPASEQGAKSAAPVATPAANAAPSGPASAAPAAAPAPAPAPAAPSPVSGAASLPAAAASSGGQRFQVGYFSREENARRLQAELATKGFSATTEARPPVGSGKDSGRWAVIVEGGPDPQATGLRLKDAGYESYPVD